ncbi:MAG: hypothetical protein Q8L48_27340 [Archangium sp.]|nr:hypothetical protein [Archangium sp.]
MFELLSLPLVALAATGWSIARAMRGDVPVAVGAAVMACVTGAAWAASSVPLEAWREGGPGMTVLAVVGSYGLGSAAAAFISRARGARLAALLSAAATVALCSFFYVEGLQGLDEALRHVHDPLDAEVIRAGARGELLGLLVLGGALSAGMVLTLLAGAARKSRSLVPVVLSETTRAPRG